MRKSIVLILFATLFQQPLSACTVISFSNPNASLVGRNWDYGDSAGAVQFVPAQHHSFALVLFKRNSYVTDGMNDQGLCMAFTGVPNVPKKYPTPFKRWSISIHLIRDVLSRCATVDEAVDLMGRTSIWWGRPWGQQIAYLIADSSGNGCIIDFVDNTMKVDIKYDSLQLLLNQHPTRPDIGYKNFGCGFCERENTINRFIAHAPQIDAHALMDGLSRVAMNTAEGGSKQIPWGIYTVWSNVYDLKKLRIATVFRRNYREVTVLDVRQLLAECTREVTIQLTEYTYAPGLHQSPKSHRHRLIKDP